MKQATHVPSQGDDRGVVRCRPEERGFRVSSGANGEAAVYVAFGEAKGWSEIDGESVLEDVHGAGAQRSDPKTGDADDYPYGNGPQGDAIRIENYAVCVSDTA